MVDQKTKEHATLEEANIHQHQYFGEMAEFLSHQILAPLYELYTRNLRLPGLVTKAERKGILMIQQAAIHCSTTYLERLACSENHGALFRNLIMKSSVAALDYALTGGSQIWPQAIPKFHKCVRDPVYNEEGRLGLGDKSKSDWWEQAINVVPNPYPEIHETFWRIDIDLLTSYNMLVSLPNERIQA